MSLGRNLELSARKILVDYGVESGANAIKVLLRHENQTATLAKYVANIQAVRAAIVSPKARTMRYRLEVTVRSDPDIQTTDTTAPETAHAANVDLVHKAFDDQPPATARQHPLVGLLNAARTALSLEFTAFFVLPIGELQVERKDRAFYDAWGYIVTCAEGVST